MFNVQKLLHFGGSAGAGAAALQRTFASAASASTSNLNLLGDFTFPPAGHWPFPPQAFARRDESTDSGFYHVPRFVQHIDDNAIKALEQHYASTFFDGAKVLDLCSSWVSHYPAVETVRVDAYGIGMNEEELASNKHLSAGYSVQDLNKDPLLKFDDESFDFVTNAVSVDYLTRPKEIFSEIYRVLKPGGTALMAFSNRMFPTKAVAIWLQASEPQRLAIVALYFQGGGFDTSLIEARDITLANGHDPMYIVFARKQESVGDSSGGDDECAARVGGREEGKKKGKVRGLICDLDGTLTLDGPKYGIDFEAMRRRAKIPDGRDILGYIAELAETDAAAAALSSAAVEDEERLALDRMKVRPHTIDALRSVSRSGARLGLLTRNEHAAVERFQELLQKEEQQQQQQQQQQGGKGVVERIVLDPILTRSFKPPKPSPAPIKHICEQWGLHPNEVVMLGDSHHDIRSASAAGARSVLIADDGNGLAGYPSDAPKPDAIISSMAELQSVLSFGSGGKL